MVQNRPLLVRRLGASTGITAVLSVAMALNVALFAVVHGALFRALPFPSADRILHLQIPFERLLAQREQFVTLPGLVAGLPLSEPTFVRHMAGLDAAVVGYSSADVRAVFVSSDFFSLFGASPSIGRTLTTADIGITPRPAVLSHSLWAARYGADPALLNRSVTLPKPVGLPVEEIVVVGVLSPGFEFPTGANVWMAYSPDESLPSPVPDYVRMAPGVTLAAIQNALPGVSIARLRDHLRPQEAWAMGLVLVNCVLLLLTSWTQAGGLAAARAWDRLTEFALRRAVGATECQLRLLAASEVGLAALVILAASWLLSFPLASAIVASLPGEFAAGLNLSPGWAAFGFAFTVTTAGSLLMISISWTAIHAASSQAPLLAPSVATRTRRARRLQSILFTIQVALVTTLMLLAGASFRSLAEAQRTELGFKPKGLFAFVMPPPAHGRAAESTNRQRVRESLEASRRVPSVVHASLASAWPLADSVRRIVMVDGLRSLEIEVQHVGIGYPDTIGARLIEGREALVGEARPQVHGGRVSSVALINQALARQLRTTSPLLGRVISISAGAEVRIVGVINDVEDSHLDGHAKPTIYSYRSDEVSGALLLVRLGEAASAALVRETLDRVWGADRTAIAVVSIDDIASRLTANHRARSFLMGLITFVCIPLTAWGIAGMVKGEISRGKRELSIRMAVGASHTNLRRTVLIRLLILAIWGIVGGNLAGTAFVRLLGTFRSVASVDLTVVGLVSLSALGIVCAAAIFGLRSLSRVAPADLQRARG